MTKHLKPISLFVNAIHDQVKNGARPQWDPISGWKLLSGKSAIAQLKTHLGHLYRRNCVGMRTRTLLSIAKTIRPLHVEKVSPVRAAIRLRLKDYTPLCGLIFCKPSGSILIVFPRHHDARRTPLLMYIMGETTRDDCKEVVRGFVEAFNRYLRRSRGRRP